MPVFRHLLAQRAAAQVRSCRQIWSGPQAGLHRARQAPAEHAYPGEHGGVQSTTTGAGGGAGITADPVRYAIPSMAHRFERQSRVWHPSLVFSHGDCEKMVSVEFAEIRRAEC